MANISIKDPSCYHITLRSYSSSVSTQLARGGSLGDIINSITQANTTALQNAASNGLQGSIANPFDTRVDIQGVFASDGNAVSIESTTEEDEFTEALDGSVCVFPKSNKNKILTIRLNSCNGVVDDIIRLKERRLVSTSGGGAGRPIVRTPIHLQFCNYCTDYTITAECAWILSNPAVSFGQDDSAVEIRILLIEPKRNNLVFASDFEAAVNRVQNGIGTVLGSI